MVLYIIVSHSRDPLSLIPLNAILLIGITGWGTVKYKVKLYLATTGMKVVNLAIVCLYLIEIHKGNYFYKT